MFQKYWYPQIIHFNRVFHYFHHPFWGFYIPLFWGVNTYISWGISVVPLDSPSRWGASYLVCAQHRNLVVYDYEDQAATATGKRMIEKLRTGRRHESIAFLRNEAGQKLEFLFSYVPGTCLSSILGFNPPKQGLFQSKQGSFGFQVFRVFFQKIDSLQR